MNPPWQILAPAIGRDAPIDLDLELVPGTHNEQVADHGVNDRGDCDE